jgi:WXG100 protein secretion system (Wss), protein EssA
VSRLRVAGPIAGVRVSLAGVRASVACLAVLMALGVCLAGAPTAGAAEISGGNALDELTKSEPEATTAATTTTTAVKEEEESNSKSSAVIYAAIGGAILLLGGIVFVIMRDVRRVAPAGDLEVAEATVAHDTALRVRRRRAKAKAARQQRKRNRSR